MRYSVNYYHYDGLGSVIALSNSSGNVVERYSYDVFGAATIRDTLHEIRAFTAIPISLLVADTMTKQGYIITVPGIIHRKLAGSCKPTRSVTTVV